MMDPLRVVSHDIKTILLGLKEVLRGGAIGVILALDFFVPESK
jgi:type III secretory pathway component EscT